jgi:hypothetical protein
MKIRTVLILATAGLAAAPALAQQSRTVTVDAPRYEGTRTATHDPDEHTLTRETDITRKSDGATASSSFERQRTDDGVTRERTSTDFEGRTSSTSSERRRTADGSESEAQHVRRDGTVADYTGQRTRTENGSVAHQTRSVNGQPAGERTVERTHTPRQPRRGGRHQAR